METQKYRALCQDCLRAPFFSDEKSQMEAHMEVFDCLCGGQFCACDDCLATLAGLESGKRGRVEGCYMPVTNWSADQGITQ